MGKARKQSVRRPQAVPKRPASVADQVDRELAATALRKRQAGETPTKRELSALKKIEKEREEAERLEHYATVPKRHYREMSGRSDKVILEQAARYGLPLRGKTVDLFNVLRAFHDFLAANKHRLASADDEDPFAATGSSPYLEKWRRERTLIARMERQEKQGRLIPRDRLRLVLGMVFRQLRETGKQLQRQCGSTAHKLYLDGIDRAEAELDREFNGEASEEEAG